MARFSAGLLALCALAALPAAASAQQVVTPSQPGAVSGTSENSDAFIWRLMTSQIAKPATAGQPTPASFETWASDSDIYFTNPPLFPGGYAAHKFHGSALAAAKARADSGYASLDADCAVPKNPWAGHFPTGSSPNLCIAEEVKRNKPQFDFIVRNKLYTQAGLAAAYANGFNVDMPASAIAVKGDWVPMQTLIRWTPNLPDKATAEKRYLTTVYKGVEYALVALHVSSKQNQAWVWGTFEHALTPGRCDFTGCHDSFGSQTANVPPNKHAVNTQYQYDACPKTGALKALMRQNGLSPVWENYCLKGTETDFVAADGTPFVLGNSVIEGINANGNPGASSCISCHAYASFGANGQPTNGAFAMLGSNPNGRTITDALKNSRPYDFMWGVLLAQ